jgi:hypothetical protein
VTSTLPSTLGTETGHATGLWALSGFPDDPSEQTLALTWPNSVRVYDRMRRDGKLSAVLRSWKHPIMGTSYHLDPNGAPDNVVLQCSADLGLPILGDDTVKPVARTRGRFQFKDHVRLALLALDYGHMPFEQVYDPIALKTLGQARLRKLGPRMPQTLQHMDVARDGGLVSISQYPSAGDPPTGPVIDIDRLVMYVNDREGGAWQGQSLLRNCYAAWYLKQDALKTHAVSIRRNGMGVPVAELPQGASQPEIDKAAALAQAFRGGEKAGGAIPGRLRLLGVEGSLPDTLGWISYLDEEMAGSALAEFLKLGSSKSGSRALGETFLEILSLALNACSQDLICDTVTAYVVEDLVDLNFGEDVQAPRVVASKIDVDKPGTALAVAELVTAGAVTLDPELEHYLRDTLGVPQRKTAQPAPTPTPPAPAPVAVAAAAAGPRKPQSAPRRDPHPHEDGVDFQALDNAWQDQLTQLLLTWKQQRDTMLDDLLEQIALALDANDLTALGTLAPATGDGARLLETAMLALADTAAAEAVAEAARQGITITPPTLDTAALTDRAQVVDELLGSSLADVAARQALLRWVEGTPVQEVTDAIREYVGALTDTYLTDQLGGALTVAQNHARFTVMSSGPAADIYASELLDTATCVNCTAKDGAHYTSVADGERDYPTGGFKDCLGGTRCRGTLVAVYSTEATPTV